MEEKWPTLTKLLRIDSQPKTKIYIYIYTHASTIVVIDASIILIVKKNQDFVEHPMRKYTSLSSIAQLLDNLLTKIRNN